MEYYTSFQSSSITKAGYDPKTRRLKLHFTGNGGYLYKEVPASKWEEFKKADSKGRFVNEEIKPYYDVEKLSD